MPDSSVVIEAKGALEPQPRQRSGASLRVEQHGLAPWNARVWLNGVELTGLGGGLTSFSIDFSAHSVTTARLTIGIEDLEIDAETLVSLQAVYAEKQRAV